MTVGAPDDGFYVEDDGAGIDPADVEDVFEAGFSTNPEGIGFGLSVVEQVAEAHDWEIRGTAGTDGGARFEVTRVRPPDAAIPLGRPDRIAAGACWGPSRWRGKTPVPRHVGGYRTD